MAQDYTLCVGTVGGGLSCSPDGGMTWNRIRNPIPSECNVRALAVYPDDPHRILAGTDVGLYRSEDTGSTWEKIESPMDGIQIWSVPSMRRTRHGFRRHQAGRLPFARW